MQTSRLNPNILAYTGIKYDRKLAGYYCADGELFLSDHQIDLCRDDVALNRLCNTRLHECSKGPKV